jgi:caffeoyl-CoA O-methyltransferase
MSENEHLAPAVHDYLIAHNPPIDPLLAELVEETRAMGSISSMQLGVEQAQLLGFMVGLLRATFVVEVGTFTGLSSLALAQALPDDGHLLCCDISEEYTAIAERYWLRAGVADRITLRIGPAMETLDDLPEQPQVDLAFIDADKPGYISYYEALVPRLAPGGVIIADNIFMGGNVAAPEPGSSAAAMVAFADHVQADARTETVILPIGDGFTLSRLVGS